MEIINTMKWRYAVKKFDPTKKLSDEQVEALLESTRLSASSFGLQPYKVVLVENPDLRKTLVEYSWGQSQIVDASHLLVLAAFSNVGEKDIQDFIALTASVRGVRAESLESFSKMLNNFLFKLDTNERLIWANNQVYIALGNLLTTCAVLNIDACPIEGFSASDYDRILGFDKLGLKTTVAIPVGYRSHEDPYLQRAKVRKPMSDFLVRI